MKLTFSDDDMQSPSPSPSSSPGQSSLARGGTARFDALAGSTAGKKRGGRVRGLLSQAVGDVLSSSLDALSQLRIQSRPQGLASAPTGQPNVHSHRLREVIERDR